MKVLLYFAFFCLILFTSIQSVNAQDDYSKINASEILKQIEIGEDVYIDKQIIVGELNLSKANVVNDANGLKVIQSSIKIRDSTINSEIDFSNVLFEKEVRISYCNITHDANFSNSHFFQIVDFRSSNFFTANYSNAIFENKVLYDHAYFYVADFNKTFFKSEAQFDNSKFTQILLTDAYFNGTVSFNYAVLKGFGGFYDLIFNKSVSFYSTDISNSAVFDNVSFKGDAFFFSPKVGNEILFTKTHFLNNSEFKGDFSPSNIRFSYVDFNGKADFSDSQYNKIDFSKTTFHSDVILNETSYEKMWVSWNSIKNNLVFNGPAYLKLRENFIEYEKYEDADDVYYKYRIESRKRDENKNIFDKFFEWIILDITCGYGVKPSKTIKFSAYSIVLFALVYSTDINLKTINLRTMIQNILIRLSFSLGVFTQMAPKNESLETRHSKLIMIEKIIGWFTLTLFTVILTNVLIRP